MHEEPEIVRILHMLARSSVRMRVLNFLADHSGERYSTSEIARALGISYSNVHGSLEGSGGKFRGDYSLVAMGMVSRSGQGSTIDTAVYTVTALGYNASSAVNQYRTKQ